MMFPSCTCCGTLYQCAQCDDLTNFYLGNVTIDFGTTGAAQDTGSDCYGRDVACADITGLIALPYSTDCGRRKEWLCKATSSSKCVITFSITRNPVTGYILLIASVLIPTAAYPTFPAFPAGCVDEQANWSVNLNTFSSCDTITSYTLPRTLLTRDAAHPTCNTATYPSSVTVYFS